MILCNARAMGEFGAVYVVSGRIAGETCTMPLQVEVLFQDFNSPGRVRAGLGADDARRRHAAAESLGRRQEEDHRGGQAQTDGRERRKTGI